MSAPVLLLPLDDRPCNRLFPARLAPLVGARVLTPPRALLGRFLRPGDPERCLQWLADGALGAVGAIISADMLCYGGLIASRGQGITLAQARRRLLALRTLHQAHPRLPLLGFGVITRLGTTVTSRATARLHQYLVRYSQQDHPRPEEVLALLQEVPVSGEEVARYLGTRERNHQINRLLVRLVAEGVLDLAVLSQEDAAATGLHRIEQRALVQEIARLGVGDRVHIYPGADEVGMVLLARLLAPGGRVRALYATAEGAQVIARYEDRPLAETVAGQVAGAGATLVEEAEAELVLAVNTPRGEQQEAGQAAEEDPDQAGLRPFLERIRELVEAGQAVAVADAAYANGADPALVAGLGPLTSRLAGYAGWNTAGNTIGTALAQGLLFARGRQEGDGRRARAQAAFLLERLVDDYGYQVRVRPQLYRQAEAQGLSPFRLGRAAPRFQQALCELLLPLGESLFQEHLAGRPLPEGFQAALRRLSVRLPWPRLFEVEVRASISSG